MQDLFGKRPRRKARQMMHVKDCGADAVLFYCRKCKSETDWIPNDYTWTELERGIPCEKCNKNNSPIILQSKKD